MKRTHSYLPATTHALQALGAQIGAARREQGWTAAELAERLGVHVALIRKIETGSPTTAAGTMIEAAVLCGVPLFNRDADDLGDVAARERDRLALLPTRIRRKAKQVSDDF